MFRYSVILLLLVLKFCVTMHIYRPWIPEDVDWCLRVHDPLWPFSYEKNIGQIFEHKGRETNNSQNFGVYCNATQALRICHICEDINTTGNVETNISHMQIQGADWSLLNKNIPVAFDTPYVAGGNHTNDYGRDDKFVCVIQDYDCLDPTIKPKEYGIDTCSIRCWGENDGSPYPVSPHPSEKELPFPTERWEYNKRKTAQGYIDTLAGTGIRGYKDGFRNESQFNYPKGVTVGLNNDVYVADTGNHCIRLIREDNVTTVIGKCGVAGFADGGVNDALFSSPTGIDFYYDNEIVYLIVADTNNHKIRKIYKDGDKYVATTLSGTRNITTITNERKTPQYGFSDGDADHARFSYPQDVAVTPEGIVYVADTLNYAIRRVMPDGNTTTIAGHRIKASNIPGCPEPCERFQQGFKDGSTTESEFYYPIGISLGPNNTILVTDQNRIRMITPDEVMSTVQNITSYNRVVTLAGSDEVGERDGRGELATFQNPKGIMMAGDGSIYVADGSCRIRRLRSEHDVALEITEDMKFNALVRPSGCMSRDYPIDRTNYKLTPHSGHIEYSNYSLIGLLNLPCVGVPTDYNFVTTNYTLTNHKGGTGYEPNYNMSDLDIGTSYRIRCSQDDERYSRGDVFYNNTENVYSDNTKICKAAIKQFGRVNDNLYKLIVREGNYIDNVFYTRTFSIEPIDQHIVETHTLAGLPTSPLDNGCGYLDNIPPTWGKLSLAYDLAMFHNTTLTNENYMYIADTENNVIRYMTATCTFICENNGTCDSPDHCSCVNGWTGYDCSIPSIDKKTLYCGPGYILNDKEECEPTCVQSCGLHGKCKYPNTCECDEGWYDANCTTPVCSQTCGNGGNCTANNTCTCPEWWTGEDCRTPVCKQDCNHGICVAPNTCMCNHEWSGYDCSKPICHQGYLVPYDDDDDVDNYKYWPIFVPCNYSEWCNDTSMFDCKQKIREQSPLIPAGTFERYITGFKELPTGCFRLEFNLTDPNPSRYFKYEMSLDNFTDNMIHQDHTPFPDLYPDLPDKADPDRMVALVELKNMTQGYYVCANGGTCYNPEQCDCTRDWVGFDCRTPVCRPSYFEEGNDEEEYQLLTTVQGYPRWQHNDMVKQGEYRCSLRAMTEFEHYWCYSPRNCSDFILDYPTYYSHYMDCPDGNLTVDGEVVKEDCVNNNYWTNSWDDPPYGWPAVHIKDADPYLDTNEGYLRKETWKTSGHRWRKGNKCTVIYHRVCKNDTEKVERLYNETIDFDNENLTIINTNITFRPVIENRFDTNDTFINRTYGRWFVDGGECIDEVIGGCWNNGTCVEPDVCVCAEGWTGKDCREPVCNNTCINGICTYPNQCTCNRGWEGVDCDIPICSQNCTGPDTNNETDPLSHGRCIGPDLCECKKWNSTIYDNRRFWGYIEGKPFYRDNYNNTQLTGWTGYDCSTPICVQAEKFVFNKPYGKYAVGYNNSILHGHEPQNNIDGEDYYPYYPIPVEDYVGEYCRNDGSCYQNGCIYGWNSTCNVTLWEAGNYPNRSGIVNYYNYTWLDWENWEVGVAEPGEGIYVCYNYGSCIAPDTCSCQDGWEGFNCSIPQCRHQQEDGNIVGCLNGGICSDRDNCTCMQTPSLLYDKYPELSWKNPDFITGWNGSDCSMPMCVQGWYDVNCTEPGISDAGEGCFRCGLCTAPDYCSCPPEWSGYDCRKPVCSLPVSGNLLYQLHTQQIEKIIEFENDPCGENDEVIFNGVNTHRGNCTSPGRCQCLCKERGSPFKDYGLRRFHGYNKIYGREDCRDGYEGEYSEDDEYFVSCHLQIYVPTTAERYTVLIVLVCLAGVILLFACWWCVSSTWRRYKLVKMVEDRRVKKNEKVAKKLADDEIEEQLNERKKREDTLKKKYDYDQLLALKSKNLY